MGETGDRRLEAGAMVLADRGIVCIDEFDKMSDMDRTAIHEVMEQGRVTIAKAGIHARLNARCSVLAAANPVYGRYNPYKSPMENIGLQDSLLSRFDCLFIMLDTIDVDSDRKIADHVVRMHRYRNPQEQDGQVLSIAADADVLTTKDLADNNEDEGETPIYEKYDALLHGNSRKKTDKIVSVQFMKKYIHIAKCMKPVLTEEASEMLADEYANLRANDFESGVARTQPVTARALETLIRLSTAHAKARLSKLVEVEDAELAIQLVQFAYFKKVLDKPGRKRRKGRKGVRTLPARGRGVKMTPPLRVRRSELIQKQKQCWKLRLLLLVLRLTRTGTSSSCSCFTSVVLRRTRLKAWKLMLSELSLQSQKRRSLSKTLKLMPVLTRWLMRIR